MKLSIKNFLAVMACAITFLSAYSMTSMAAQSAGSLDTVSDNKITGWTWNPDAPDTSIHITISVFAEEASSPFFQKTQVADEIREDLTETCSGHTEHGFSVDADWTNLEDGLYRIEASTLDGVIATQTYQKGEPAAPASVPAVSGNIRSLGQYKLTAYCPCYKCSEGWGRHTSTGAMARAKHTIAVDPRVIPYGSKIMINGTVYTAEDRGGAVKGNHIDVFFDTHGETRQHGTRNSEVFIIE